MGTARARDIREGLRLQEHNLIKLGEVLRISPRQTGTRAQRACPVSPGAKCAAFRPLKLEVAVDEVVLLEASEPLPDFAGPDGADSLHGLEIALGGSDDRVEPLRGRSRRAR